MKNLFLIKTNSLKYVLMALGLVSCATPTKPETSLVTASQESQSLKENPKKIVKEDTPVPPAPVAVVPIETPAASSPPPTDCHQYGRVAPPFFLKNLGVVATQFDQECETNDKLKGFKKGASIIAMGIPCTGADGKFSITGGNYDNPKMVKFFLTNDCKMQDVSAKELKKELGEVLAVEDEYKLLAMYPFDLMFWSIEGSKESDVSSTIELRTNEVLRQYWKDFITKKSPIQVKLYGRVNSWAAKNDLFMVEAKLICQERKKFRLQITSIKPMSEAEKHAAKTYCESLKPQRECFKVF